MVRSGWHRRTPRWATSPRHSLVRTLRTRGRLVTYLGTAPGVGKTYRMLADGLARALAGEDVVIGWVERHGRAATREQALRLEIVPPRTVTYRGFEFEDIDVPVVIERRPDVVLVDELAHTNPDGQKRYEVVEELLDAGIDVMTTVNVANLLSVRDSRLASPAPARSRPCPMRSCAPVTSCSSICRPRHCGGESRPGRCTRPTDGGALANYFRPSNLTLLSQLARPGSTARSTRPSHSSTARRPAGRRSSPACRARPGGRR